MGRTNTEDKKKDIAKKAGVLYGAKKVIGKVGKLAIFAAAGAAVVKVLRREQG